MREKWLNMILSLTAKVYKTKQKLITSSSAKGMLIAVYVILLEIVLFIVSIPFYFIVGERFTIGKNIGDKDIISYKLRRKFFVSLIIFIIIIAIAFFAFKGAINVFFKPDFVQSTL